MRGRIGWWRRVWSADGTGQVLSVEEAKAHELAVAQVCPDAERVNQDILGTQDGARRERLARLRSHRAKGLRKAGQGRRGNVNRRLVRLHLIAEILNKEPPLARLSAVAIATILCNRGEFPGISVNQLRQDVGKVRKT